MPQKDAFLSAGDFLKYSLTLATGALVFSLELVKEDVSLTAAAKWLLVFAWVLLLVSVIGGVLTFARFPVQMADSNYNLADRLLVLPWRIHQVAFALGIVCLGITLVVALLSRAPTTTPGFAGANSEFMKCPEKMPPSK